MKVVCKWQEPRMHRDSPEPPWQDGTLLQFVCDPGGYIHGMIATIDGKIVRAHYDLIRVTDV